MNNRTLLQMIEACKREGSISHQYSMMASAFAALKIPQQNCFSCGKPGHVKHNCPDSQRSQGPSICPRCKKGHHFVSQCQSQFDKNSKLIPGNRNRSAKRGRAMTQAALAPSTLTEPLHQDYLQEQTGGSARVDLATSISVTLRTTAVPAVPIGIWGPLGCNKSTLLIGCSSTSMQGLFVLPGLIDADFKRRNQNYGRDPSPSVFYSS